MICRNRRRHTSTTIIMLSMSLAYMLFLSFYAFKVSVYLEGNNITKFHMYEIIDNWTHGQFLCRFISGLPVFVKLIVRLSILAITIKRLFKAFDCDCSQGKEFIYKKLRFIPWFLIEFSFRLSIVFDSR